jgi:hypothetical protein
MDTSDEDFGDEIKSDATQIKDVSRDICANNYGCDSSCKTELAMIDSLDFIVRPSGKNSLILNCTDRPAHAVYGSLPRSGMRWL